MEKWQKNLTRNIAKLFKERKFDVPPGLVAFLISLLSLSPNFQEDNGQINIKTLADAVAEKLLSESDETLIIIKMQLHFINCYQSRDEIIAKHRKQLKQKTKHLIKDICETRAPLDEQCAQYLYHKVMVVISLLFCLGKPTSPQVDVALQSVFPPDELSYFLELSYRKREAYLIELTCIVGGIRIFNSDCEHSAKGIDYLPTILEHVVSRTEATIVVSLRDVMHKIYKYTAAIEQFLPCFELETALDNEKTTFYASCVRKLTCLRQEEFYLRKILSDTDTSKEQSQAALKQLRDGLLLLHETVFSAKTIPSIKVYPQFVSLANVWMKLQDEVIILSHVNKFLSRLQSLCASINASEDAELEQIIRGVKVLSDLERLRQSMCILIPECENCRVLYPNDTPDFDKLELEFLGFCPRTFVVGEGALIPGNPNMGVIQWEEKCFAFSSLRAAQKFGQDPDSYYTKALDLMRRRPEFVHLFLKQDTIGSSPIAHKLSTESETQQKNCESQTDIHIQLPLFDRNYSSSIWEHRRRALQLVKIFQCKTKSMQTNKSHFRQEVEVQTYPPTDKNVQTNVDHSTNTKRYLRHTTGPLQKFEEFVLPM